MKRIKKITLSTILLVSITFPILIVLSCGTSNDNIEQVAKLNNEIDKITDHPDAFYEVTNKGKNTVLDENTITKTNINEYIKNLPRKNSNTSVDFKIIKIDIILGIVYLKIIMKGINQIPIESNIKKIKGFAKLDLSNLFIDNLAIFNDIEEINVKDIKNKLIVNNETILNLTNEKLIDINISKINFLNSKEIKLFFNFYWENEEINLEQILQFKIKQISQFLLNIYPFDIDTISKIYASEISNDNIRNYIYIPNEKILNVSIKNYDDEIGELTLSFILNNQEEQLKIIDGFKQFKPIYIEQGIFKYYIKNNNSAVLYGYIQDNNKDNTLTIPESIIWNNKLLIVDEIGEDAFISQNIISIAFSKNIKIIKERAFRANKITNLTFPDSLKEIEHAAFSNNKIDEIIFSNELEIIGANAFNNSQVKKINFLPSKLKELGSYAFYGNELKDIKINNLISKIGNDPFTYKDFKNFNYSDDWNNQIKQNKYNFSMNILNDTDISITGLINNADNNKNLIIPNVVINNNKKYNVTQIENHSFVYKDYDTVTIPNSVTSIGANAFSIDRIKEMNIPENFMANKINDNVLSFRIINNDDVEITGFLLKTSSILTIPSFININNKKYNVTSIGSHSFINHTLSEINIPDSVVSIKLNAFSSNKDTDNKISWKIPKWFMLKDNTKIFFNILDNDSIRINQIYIDELFDGNLILPNEILINDINKKISSIGFYALAHKKIKTLILPNELQIINSFAIMNNLIENIFFPNEIVFIGTYAFLDNKINNININNKKENILINTLAFDKNVKIYYL